MGVAIDHARQDEPSVHVGHVRPRADEPLPRGVLLGPHVDDARPSTATTCAQGRLWSTVYTRAFVRTMSAGFIFPLLRVLEQVRSPCAQ